MQTAAISNQSADSIARAAEAHGQNDDITVLPLRFAPEPLSTELMEQNRSAAEVAATAQRFGQEDDISVISLTRTGVLTPALA